MKKIVALLASTTILASVMTGCGAAKTETVATATPKAEANTEVKQETPKPEEKKVEGKIVFATNRTDVVDTVITDMVNDFMSKYPDIKVEIEPVKEVANMNIRAAAGELPDVAIIPGEITQENLPTYFESLDDIGFTNDNTYFLDAGKGPDGKIYKISDIVVYQNCITYNKAAFKKAGIEQIPKTQPELLEACEKLKAIGVVPFATAFKDKWPIGDRWSTGYPMAISGNPKFFNELKDRNALLEEDTLQGLKFLRTLNEKGYLDKDLMSASWDALKPAHAQGKYGMFYMGSWYTPQVVEAGAKQEDIGIFPMPETKMMDVVQNWGYGIAKTTKNLEAAKVFYKWAFFEGNYAKYQKYPSSMKNVEISDPFINELMACGLPVLETAPKDPETHEIELKSEIDWGSLVQEYVLSDNPEQVVKTYNEKYAVAKKAILGQ